MIRFEVSSLGYPMGRAGKMAELPPDFGIEIFYEWGGSSFWLENMKRVMKDREGSFSIHSPFGYCDFAQTQDEAELFRFMTEPFDLYHRLNGRHYVVHTNGHVDRSVPEEKREDMRRLAADRLAKFEEICEHEGVCMVVENVPDGGHTLFNHDQFLALFTDNPKLNCIIDTGHAHMEHLDMLKIQKALGSRLKAYHVHDNGGNADSHLRFMSGVKGGIDWQKFVDGVMNFTPDAAITFEYNADQGGTAEYEEDRRRFLKLAGM